MSTIYFDHRWCAPHGIGRFATELRNRLAGLTDLPLTGSPTSPLDALRLARFLHRSGGKTFFTPGFNVPAFSSCQVITTIHDLIHVYFGSESSVAKRTYYRYVQRRIVRRSPVTFTVSEYSRQQIVNWYDVPENRVIVVGNGVSEEFNTAGPVHQSDTPYFLYVGNSKPHKNLSLLLRAHATLVGDVDVRLKLVTAPGIRLQQQLDDHAFISHIDHIHHASDETLASLYRGAIALVMPSYAEGFGLPLVEAMACGCPVIASNRTAIPEVLAGAGVLFDPDTVDDLVEAMGVFLGSNSEQREELIRRGLSRARDFQWSSVAARTSRALRDVTE